MSRIAGAEPAGSGVPRSRQFPGYSPRVSLAPYRRPRAVRASREGADLRTYFRLRRTESGPGSWGSGRARLRRLAALEAQRQVEAERQRLGRELHTGVGQTLAAIRLQLEVISLGLRQPPEAVGAALERLSVLTGKAVEQVRGLSGRLHPPEWHRLTMEEAVLQLWELSGIPQRLEASLRIEALPQSPPLAAKILVYRTLQEALSNLTRHAQATRVDVALAGHDGRLCLTVQDNGVGFDVAAVESAPASLASGIGLRSIREQAAALGARLEVESGPEGTKLRLSAPLLHNWH